MSFDKYETETTEDIFNDASEDMDRLLAEADDLLDMVVEEDRKNTDVFGNQITVPFQISSEHEIEELTYDVERFEKVVQYVNETFKDKSEEIVTSEVEDLLMKTMKTFGERCSDRRLKPNNVISESLKYETLKWNLSTDESFDMQAEIQIKPEKRKEVAGDLKTLTCGSNFTGESFQHTPLPDLLVKEIDGKEVKFLLKQKTQRSELITQKGMAVMIHCNDIAKPRSLLERTRIKAVNAVMIKKLVKKQESTYVLQTVQERPSVEIGEVNLREIYAKLSIKDYSVYATYEDFFKNIMKRQPDFKSFNIANQINIIRKLTSIKKRVFSAGKNTNNYIVKNFRNLFSNNYDYDFSGLRDILKNSEDQEDRCEHYRNVLEYVYRRNWEIGKGSMEIFEAMKHLQKTGFDFDTYLTGHPRGPGENFWKITNKGLGYDGCVVGGGDILIRQKPQTNLRETELSIQFKNGVKKLSLMYSDTPEELFIFSRMAGCCFIKVLMGTIEEGVVYAESRQAARQIYRNTRYVIGDIFYSAHRTKYLQTNSTSKKNLVKLSIPVHNPKEPQRQGMGFLNGEPNLHMENDVIKWEKQKVIPFPSLQAMVYDDNLGILSQKVANKFKGSPPRELFLKSKPLDVENPDIEGLRSLALDTGAEAYFEAIREVNNLYGFKSFETIYAMQDYENGLLKRFVRFADLKGESFMEKSTYARRLIKKSIRFELFFKLLPYLYKDPEKPERGFFETKDTLFPLTFSQNDITGQDIQIRIFSNMVRFEIKAFKHHPQRYQEINKKGRIMKRVMTDDNKIQYKEAEENTKRRKKVYEQSAVIKLTMKELDKKVKIEMDKAKKGNKTLTRLKDPLEAPHFKVIQDRIHKQMSSQKRKHREEARQLSDRISKRSKLDLESVIEENPHPGVVKLASYISEATGTRKAWSSEDHPSTSSDKTYTLVAKPTITEEDVYLIQEITDPVVEETVNRQ